jgi:hypothetical protein
MVVVSADAPRFGVPIGEFHRVFAWLPVRTYDRRLVWLRPVWRRCIQKHDYLTGGPDFWWQYSLPDEPNRAP